MRRWLVSMCLFACGDNGAVTGTLSCQDTDTFFYQLRVSDAELAELSRCETDADCVSWRPLLQCDGEIVERDCAAATRAGNEAASQERLDEITPIVCRSLNPSCKYNPACPSKPTFKCTEVPISEDETATYCMPVYPDAGA